MEEEATGQGVQAAEGAGEGQETDPTKSLQKRMRPLMP